MLLNFVAFNRCSDNRKLDDAIFGNNTVQKCINTPNNSDHENETVEYPDDGIDHQSNYNTTELENFEDEAFTRYKSITSCDYNCVHGKSLKFVNKKLVTRKPLWDRLRHRELKIGKGSPKYSKLPLIRQESRDDAMLEGMIGVNNLSYKHKSYHSSMTSLQSITESWFANATDK